MHTVSRTTLFAVVCGVLLLTGGVGLLATTSPSTGTDSQPQPSAVDANRTTLEQVHASGVTGGNVTVGVIDVTGFDRNHSALAGRVDASRAFGSERTVGHDGRNEHGTAAAATVARTAPNATLVLATFDDVEDFDRGVEWLVERDVDVIVAPVEFYGRAGDGSSAVSRAATAAVREGVVFVAPSGNLAQRHWTGRYDDVENGTLRFGAADVRENSLVGDDDYVSVWLTWDDRHRSEDYTVELYEREGERARLVARSRRLPTEDGTAPSERLVATVDGGSAFVVVRGPEDATGTRLRLSSPTHNLAYSRPAGSLVAPATGRGVLVVGAFDDGRDRLRPFSSRGPTADSRLGVDLVARDGQRVVGHADRFVGTSAAASYTGGVAALVLDANPRLSPREVEVRVEQTAVDVGEQGADPATGHGRLDLWRAVGAGASNSTAQSAT